MGFGCIGDHSVKKFIDYNGRDRGCAPDPAAFSVVNKLPESINPTPAVRPWTAGGCRWGKIIFNLLEIIIV